VGYIVYLIAKRARQRVGEAIGTNAHATEDADMKCGLKAVLISSLAALASVAANANAESDRQVVSALDTKYQAAVKNNDATTMDQILAEDFVVVIGNGKIYSKADLLNMARTKQIVYEHQEEEEQTVRVWGDTAVVTAKLWLKGADQDKSFDWHIWFSDTYVRTPSGWRYVHGQASLPMHATEK
jgi:ketosteroid isomerase-like protein